MITGYTISMFYIIDGKKEIDKPKEFSKIFNLINQDAEIIKAYWKIQVVYQRKKRVHANVGNIEDKYPS
jgi:hypothetical protein